MLEEAEEEEESPRLSEGRCGFDIETDVVVNRTTCSSRGDPFRRGGGQGWRGG